MTALAIEEHGTARAYRAGCKCPECKAAIARYVAEHRRSPRTYIPAGKVRTHLAELREAGLSLNEIARQAGVASSTVGDLVSGANARCTVGTKRRILGVLPRPSNNISVRRPKRSGNPFERFYSYVEFTEDCWFWHGSTQQGGYGTFTLRRGESWITHRLAYTWAYGPIPEGLHIDHLCRVRSCVNPAHLEAVTREENERRVPAESKALRGNPAHRAKTHCPQGHPYEGANLRIIKGNRRQCVTCNRLRCQAYRDGTPWPPVPFAPPPEEPEEEPDPEPRFDDPLAGLMLRLTSPDMAWKADADCRRLAITVQRRQEWFFPERGESTKPAFAVCSRCPVWSDCLTFALDTQAEGIWGRSAGSHRRKIIHHAITVAELADAGMADDPGLSIDLGIQRVLGIRFARAWTYRGAS